MAAPRRPLKGIYEENHCDLQLERMACAEATCFRTCKKSFAPARFPIIPFIFQNALDAAPATGRCAGNRRLQWGFPGDTQKSELGNPRTLPNRFTHDAAPQVSTDALGHNSPLTVWTGRWQADSELGVFAPRSRGGNRAHPASSNRENEVAASRKNRVMAQVRSSGATKSHVLKHVRMCASLQRFYARLVLSVRVDESPSWHLP